MGFVLFLRATSDVLIVTARRTGVALTIDPAHVAEVREYLGTLFYHLLGFCLTMRYPRRPGDSAFLLHPSPCAMI